MNKKYLAIYILGIVFSYFVFSSVYKSQNQSLVKNPIFEQTSFGSSEDPFERMEYEKRMLADPATGEIPDNIRNKELKFAHEILQAQVQQATGSYGLTNLTWDKRGPINRGGRTRALGIDVRTQTPGNVTIIAGGASGGIYKSTDDGQTWVDKLSPEDIHSVTSIAQDTRAGQENTWYVGTGESSGTAGIGNAGFWGDGIYKSTDNGESWNLLASTSNGQVQTFNTAFRFVNNVVVNKTTGSVFAAASNVILRSTNGGTSWTIVRSTLANNQMSEIQITNSGVLYAAIHSGLTNAGISKSTNDGATWTTITPSAFPAAFGRIVIGIAPSNENIVYFFVHTSGQGTTETQLWKYNASGNTWSNLTSNLPTIGGKVGDLNVQGAYDMVIKIKPDDANFVVLGGTNLYRSTDGFSSKVTSSGWIGGYAKINDVSQYVNHHPDQHSLVFLTNSNSAVLYSGSDGGISRTNNVAASSVAWTSLNTGYVTSQFYSLAIDNTTSNSDIIIGGMQDNGNYFINSASGNSPWAQLPLGGDGGYTAITNGHTDYYFETQKGNVWRFKLGSNGIFISFAKVKPDYSTSYLFVTPFALDPNDNKMMYMAVGDSVWRNSDLTGIPLGNQNATNINWSALSNSKMSSAVSAIGISKSPANRLYVGSGSGTILRIDGANSGDPTSVNISSGKGLPSGAYVSCLYVDPENADNVVAVFSNYKIPSLFFTQDGGNSWTNISGNLEQNSDGSGNGPSCRWVTKLTFDGITVYYAATSTGLYSTSQLNGSSTVWVQEGLSTIGNVVCPMVKSRSADGLVAVATHGAGVFSSIQTATAVDDEEIIINKFELLQNYPNPFNPSTIISYQLPSSSFVSLKVYDALGKEIATLVNKQQSGGNYKVNFNAASAELASGVYLYRLTASGASGKLIKSRKMILLK